MEKPSTWDRPDEGGAPVTVPDSGHISGANPVCAKDGVSTCARLTTPPCVAKLTAFDFRRSDTASVGDRTRFVLAFAHRGG